MYAQWMKCSGHELRNAQKDKIAIFREKYLDNKRRQYCDLCQAIYELKTSQYSKCCFPRIKIPHGSEHIKKTRRGRGQTHCNTSIARQVKLIIKFSTTFKSI